MMTGCVPTLHSVTVPQPRSRMATTPALPCVRQIELILRVEITKGSKGNKAPLCRRVGEIYNSKSEQLVHESNRQLTERPSVVYELNRNQDVYEEDSPAAMEADIPPPFNRFKVKATKFKDKGVCKEEKELKVIVSKAASSWKKKQRRKQEKREKKRQSNIDHTQVAVSRVNED